MSAIAPESAASPSPIRRTSAGDRETPLARAAAPRPTLEATSPSSRWLFSFDGWFVDDAHEGFVLA